MPSTTINVNNLLNPCKLTISKGGGDPYAKWINQTGGTLTLRSTTIQNYFNDRNGNAITPPLIILGGNPAQGGGLQLQLKDGVTPPVSVDYTIDNVACNPHLGGGADDPSIDIQN